MTVAIEPRRSWAASRRPGRDVRPRLPGRGVRRRAPRARHPGADRVLDDREGVARVPSEGLSLLHRATSGIPQSQTVRDARVHRSAPCVVVGDRASSSRCPVSIGIALFITEVAPRWLRTPDHLRDRPARRGARRSSTASGACWCSRPALARLLPGRARPRCADVPVLNTLFSGDPISGTAFMTAGLDPRDHDHADRHRRSPARRSRPCPQSQKDARATRWARRAGR